MISVLVIFGPILWLSWILIAAGITCLSRKRGNKSLLEKAENKPSGKSHRTEEIFTPCATDNIKTSVSRTRSNNKSETIKLKKKPQTQKTSSKPKLDKNWKRRVRKIPKDGGDVEEPSADRDASPKEEKPVVEQTRIFSWNSNKRRTSSNESSLDEFEKPTPLLEVTATEMSATQSSIHVVTPNEAVSLMTPTAKPSSETKIVKEKLNNGSKTPSTSPTGIQGLPLVLSSLPEQPTQPMSISVKSKSKSAKKVIKPGKPTSKKLKNRSNKESKNSPSTPTPPMVILVDLLKKADPEPNSKSNTDKEKQKSSSKSLENDCPSKKRLSDSENRVAIVTK